MNKNNIVNKNMDYDDESIASFGSIANSPKDNINTVNTNADDITINSEDVFSYESTMLTNSNIDNNNEEKSHKTNQTNNLDSHQKNKSLSISKDNITIKSKDNITIKSKDNFNKSTINKGHRIENKNNYDDKTLASFLTPHQTNISKMSDYSTINSKDIFNFVSNITSNNSMPKDTSSSSNFFYSSKDIHSNKSLYNKDISCDAYNIDRKKVIIDVAVLCQEYTNVETTCDDNIVNLDEISVTKEMFQAIFFPYRDNFGINKDFINNHTELLPIISFLPEHRTTNNNKKKFYLLEELIANIEKNLNISRNCFTKDSLVELTNEIIGIKSLLDINCCSVLSSLSWPNVLEVIENYKLVNHNDDKIVPVCVVNIVFKTPTADVKNTTVRFHYKITDY